MLDPTAKGFNDFIEKLPIAIACFDEKRKFFAINQACVELNGVAREDTLGKKIADVVPELVESLAAVFDKVYLHSVATKNTLIEGKTPASKEH